MVRWLDTESPQNVVHRSNISLYPLVNDDLTVEDLYKRATQEVDCLKDRLGS